MLEKLKILEQKFNEISDLIIKPDVIADQKKYIKISKEYKDCLLYTSPSPRDDVISRMPSSA